LKKLRIGSFDLRVGATFLIRENMSNSALTNKTLKNASYSFISYGWGLIFALFITPIIVFKLGVDNYGVYIFVGVVGSIAGLIDLGLSTAIYKYMAEYIGSNNKEKLSNLIKISNTLFLIIGVIGFVLLSLIGIFGNVFISNSTMLIYDIKIIFIIIGLIFFINAANSSFTIIPRALQRFDITTKVGFFTTALPSLSILLVVSLNMGIKEIFIVQLFFSAIFSFLYYSISRKLLPIAKYHFSWKKLEIKKIYKFGFAAFISNFSGQTLSYFDKLIIPIFINPASLSYYSLPGSVASKSNGVLGSISSILFPVVSTLQGEKNNESIKNLYIRSFRLTTVLNAAITFSICFLSYEIMRYWLDESFAQKAGKILLILSITYFFVSIYDQAFNFLLGLGKSKILAKFSFVMASINVILLFVLLPKYGIMGAAIAYLISLLSVIYIIYYIERKVLLLSGRLLFYIKFYSKIIFVGLILYLISIIFIKPSIVDFKSLMFFGPLSVIIYLTLFRIFNFYERQDLDSLNKFKIIILNRFKIKKI